MDDIEEKRVYGDRTGRTELLVAAAMGVLAVDVSDDRVGGFGVAHRCVPADVATSGGRVAVATDEDVLVREPDSRAFGATGFGPAAAVGFDDGTPVAAGLDGRVARLDGGHEGESGRGANGSGASGSGGSSSGASGADGADDAEGAVDADVDAHGPAWTELGYIDAGIRAIDGRLLAAADGVYRLPALDFAGLDDARDVAAAGPLAATGDGLYSLGNGWMDELEGAFQAVTSDGRNAHAATQEAFYERRAGDWRAVELPEDGRVVDVAYGDAVYAVTADGSVVAEGEDGWRSHPLGVDGVVGCAVR